MYEPTIHDKPHYIDVWGRYGKRKNRVLRVCIYRHTRMEALAFVTALGYKLVDGA